VEADEESREEEAQVNKLSTMLWFDGQAEEAAKFYASVFKGKLGKPMVQPGTQKVLVATFEIRGQEFSALNGGPRFKFNESVSFVVHCKDQKEVDYYWDKLTADGGEESMCGWLKDKYGLSWQVVPVGMNEMLNDPDEARGQRAMKAMLGMKKIDLAALYAAADGV